MSWLDRWANSGYRIRHRNFSPEVHETIKNIVQDWKRLDSPDRVDTNVLIDMLAERLSKYIDSSSLRSPARSL